MLRAELLLQLRLNGQMRKAKDEAIMDEINDWGVLVKNWERSARDPARQQQILARIKELAASISDWDRLADMWDATEYESAPETVIELRMDEVLPIFLATITDWDKLVAVAEYSCFDTPAHQQVETRQQAVLPDILISITNSEELRLMLEETSPGSENERLIQARIAQLEESECSNNRSDSVTREELLEALRLVNERLAKEELRKALRRYGHVDEVSAIVFVEEVTKWNDLVEEWRQLNTEGDDCQQNEAQQAEFIKAIVDWDVLIEMADIANGCGSPYELVRQHMMEIMPTLLTTITDYFFLKLMWAQAFTYPLMTVNQLIEHRMAELISAVTCEDYPQWFLPLLADWETCPVRECLNNKVIELKESLKMPA